MPSFSQILNITRSGMLSRMLNIDVVSNNLSNVNTVGFKHTRANFQEMLNAEKKLSGTEVLVTQHLMDPGSIKSAASPLDVAINGSGFFALRLPDDRIGYTRNGEFYLDADRQIIDANGFKLEWSGQVPEGTEDLHINPDGAVMVKQGDIWSEAGRIGLTRFANPAGLEGYGQNLWLESEASGAAEAGEPNSNGMGFLLGNALEGSNVDLSEEMVQLINLQRSFSMSLRTFQQTDEMLTQAIRMRSG
jgi:flagellar basal-body rod protein FlgG